MYRIAFIQRFGIQMLKEAVTESIEKGILSPRLWMYSNYHCNLSCSYCLTESAPSSAKRLSSREQMISWAKQAKKLGFQSIGITGGEPFFRPDIEDVIEEILTYLPVTVLTNGTLFHQKRLNRIRMLAGKDFSLQISLDSASPARNDEFRGVENFNKVCDAIPKLIDVGIRVRIATTISQQSSTESADLRRLVQSLGVHEEDHVVRTIVSRGRATTQKMGVDVQQDFLMPELTLTTEGAFWSPFAPTYKKNRLEKDLLLTTIIDPVSKSTEILLSLLKDFQMDPSAEESGFV